MEANLSMNQGSSPVSLAVIPVTESAYSKMRKMIASPRGKRRSSTSSSSFVAKTFGVPLDELVAKDCHESGVPSVVHKMCQFILDNGIISEGIFRVNGNMKTVDKLKTQLDKNGDADLEEVNDVMAVASLLKMFLRELPDSVIPSDMQSSFIKAHGLREDKEKHLMVLRHLIQKMPLSNYDLLKYLINFLNHITDSSDANKMTPVALAVVFGPNIFRCSETLQGLQEQACVNAITCKLIEQYSYLFSVGKQNMDETPRSNSSTGESSPRKKPARPPPPNFQHGIVSPRKMCEDENSNMVGNESEDTAAEKRSNNDITRKVKSHSVNISSNEAKNRSSVTISFPEPNQSKATPIVSNNGGFGVDASPSRKQILDNTIRDAVKSNLFGANFVTSSSESDTQGTDALHSPGEQPGGENSQSPNIRNMLKMYAAGKLSESVDKKNAENNLDSESKNHDLPDDQSIIDQIVLDQMKDHWTGTLTSLTSNRAPPPRRQRRDHRIERRTQSESTDEVLKQKSNEMIINDINKQKTMAKAENPLLVRIKNERVIKSLDDLDSEGNFDYQSPVTSPRILHSTKLSVPAKANNFANVREENGVRPVVPPLNLFRVHQIDDEDHISRMSSKERFSEVLPDGPIRSPRDFQYHDHNEMHAEHKQQLFLEKRQDTVPVLDMSPKDLKKRIDYLKKTIANFENAFEAQHHRPPKPTEKSQVNKYIAELGRARKQLKEVLNTMKDNPDQSSQDIGFAPNLRDVKLRNKETTKEDTLNALLKRLTEKRCAAGRPEELELMSPEQLKDEKLAVQKALLQYENLHGRPCSKDDKILMRPIYERYRRIKKLIGKSKDSEPLVTEESEKDENISRLQDSQKDSSVEGAPVTSNFSFRDGVVSNRLEDNNNSNSDAWNLGSTNEDELNDTFNITRKPPDLYEKVVSNMEANVVAPRDTLTAQTMSEAVLHGATLEELLSQQKLAKKSKKNLGKTLKDFEDDFFVKTGRKVQKEDRGPLEDEYIDYKQLRARLRLLDVLITKKKANETV